MLDRTASARPRAAVAFEPARRVYLCGTALQKTLARLGGAGAVTGAPRCPAAEFKATELQRRLLRYQLFDFLALTRYYQR